MPHLVPIKIKIGLKPNGHAKYPDFNTLPSVVASGQDWSHYVDAQGTGWLYDCCGHKEQDADSPFGQQWGMLLVPQEFASEAVAAFSAECEKLTDVQCEAFYNDKHGKDIDDEEIDQGVLDAIKRKQDVGATLTPRQVKALNPTDDTRGIRPNKDKTWAGFKAKRGITVER